MLRVRPYLNEDPPRLIDLWNKIRATSSHHLPISESLLDLGPLNFLFQDRSALKIAFDDETPVGFAHGFLAPDPSNSRLSKTIGQIGFLGLDPTYADPIEAGKLLISSCEQYLRDQGVVKIFGGSPHPSAPQYMGLYGEGEPVGFFDSDKFPIQSFLASGFQRHCKSARFVLDLDHYDPPITPETLEWFDQLEIEITDHPRKSSWWNECRIATSICYEATARFDAGVNPVARIMIRMASAPSDLQMDDSETAMGSTAGLIDINVAPTMTHQGIATYALGETLHRLGDRHVSKIEAHISEDNADVMAILRSLQWQEVETGTIFVKNF